MEDRAQGPVEILCKEIGFRFTRRMERADIFVAFVRELVREVAEMREMQERIAGVTGKSPSAGSAIVLRLALDMVAEARSAPEMGQLATAVHDAAYEHNPEEACPTDHLIDMLSGCASAIRWGLEMPCRSRHAADAAHQIWAQKYGVHLFDQFTPAWTKEWARAQLDAAILSLATPREAVSA